MDILGLPWQGKFLHCPSFPPLLHLLIHLKGYESSSFIRHRLVPTLLPCTTLYHPRRPHHPRHVHHYIWNDRCARRYLQHPTWRNHRPPRYVWTVERYHCSTISCTRSKCGSIKPPTSPPMSTYPITSTPCVSITIPTTPVSTTK